MSELEVGTIPKPIIREKYRDVIRRWRTNYFDFYYIAEPMVDDDYIEEKFSDFDKEFLALIKGIANEHIIVCFPNGYILSAIRGNFTIGGKDNLWEVLVTNFSSGESVNIPGINTPHGEVVGYLHYTQVANYISRVAQLADVRAGVVE